MASTGCTDYLDRDPDAEVSEAVAFQNFTNFQGFVEEIYNCIPEKESCYWTTTFNWGEDEIMNAGEGDSHFSHQMDLGNYRNWINNDQTYLGGVNRELNATSDNKFDHRIWGHAWYCIRKCNLGLQNLDLMTEATEEERNFIAGQLYFFRAWWHQELMIYFGGLPYIDKVLDGATKLEEPRLSFAECAEKVAADFRKAADLLPNNWDNTLIGAETKGHNDLRITKVTALAYLGKIQLWAASPLMKNATGVLTYNTKANTYDYDAALAGQAAESLGKALAQVASGATPYALHVFNYSDVFNHEEASSNENNYHEIFYTVSQSWKMPGGTEAIMRGPQPGVNGSNWNFTKLWGSKVNSLVEHDKIIHMPTANYVNYAYGMANGRALTDPQSGFDPTHPFKDRDPRFYHDIIFDGLRYVNTTIDDGDENRPQQYAAFYSGSEMRDANLGSRTGYFCQKLVSHKNNKYDNYYGWSFAEQCYLPYMRLADIYLMYAEALTAAGKITSTAGGCTLNAIDAINVLRNRVGCAEVADDQKSGNAFMEVVRRERACELAFEGFRWNDLQRWCLLDKAPYNKKTSQEFNRVKGNETITVKVGGADKTVSVENAWYRENSAVDAEVTNWREVTIRERQLDAKHYWFPFPDSEVYLYKDFPQNAGW